MDEGPFEETPGNARGWRSGTREVNLWGLQAKDRDRHVAVHESGHAIIGMEQALPLLLVDIRPQAAGKQSGGLVLGGTVFDAPDGDMKELARQRPEQVAVMAMSGVAAEELLLGCHGGGGWKGDLDILRCGFDWTDALTPEQQEAVLGFMDLADAAVRRSEAALGALSDALLRAGRLDGADVAVIVQSVDRTLPDTRPTEQ